MTLLQNEVNEMHVGQCSIRIAISRSRMNKTISYHYFSPSEEEEAAADRGQKQLRIRSTVTAVTFSVVAPALVALFHRPDRRSTRDGNKCRRVSSP